MNNPAPWHKPWISSLLGWKHFLRPRFILPSRRQLGITALIHFGVGIPAAVLSCLRGNRRRQPPGDILFAGRYHLGDVLMTLPAVTVAREALPGSRMTIVVQDRYRHHLAFSKIGLQTVPEIEGMGFFAELREWRRRLRDGKYDAIVFHRITRPDFPAVLAAFLENIPHRVGGAEKGLQGLLTDVYFPQERELVVRYHWNLIIAWLQLPPSPPRLQWPPLVDLPRENKRWDLLIAPFAQHTKEWPPEYWHMLLQEARNREMSVALSAAPSQKDRAAQLLSGFPEVEDLSPRSATMIDLFSDVNQARCVIAVDTGIRHVAAILGVPCVVLGHGREHYRLFGAYVPTERYLFHPVPCAPCGAEPCPLGHLRCIRGIPLESVLQAWDSLISPPS